MFGHHMHYGPDPRQRRPGNFEPNCDPRRAFAHFGGRHGHFERFFAAGGGGRERFDPGDLQLVILSLLAEKPSYGYELIKAIEDRVGGGYAPSPGVIYPTLTLLEERGFAQVVPSEGARKTYAITEAGQAELQKEAGRLADLLDRFQEGKERFGHGRSPKIRRAFLDLRQAVLRVGLRSRESRQRLTEEQMDRIAEAIQKAARAIDEI